MGKKIDLWFIQMVAIFAPLLDYWGFGFGFQEYQSEWKYYC